MPNWQKPKNQTGYECDTDQCHGNDDTDLCVLFFFRFEEFKIQEAWVLALLILEKAYFLLCLFKRVNLRQLALQISSLLLKVPKLLTRIPFPIHLFVLLIIFEVIAKALEFILNEAGPLHSLIIISKLDLIGSLFCDISL